MTRGTMILFLPDKVIRSIEFNGDMGRFGNYKEAVRLMTDANSRGEFEYGLEIFNATKYQYEFNPVENISSYKTKEKLKSLGIDVGGDKIKVDLVDQYFERWFSDYLFFKNMSGRTIEFLTINEGRTGKEIYEIKHGEVFVSHFSVADAQVSASDPNKIIDWGLLLGTQQEKI